MTSGPATRFRACVLLVYAMCASITLGCEREPPNIILMIGDDHGYPYYGFTGSEIVKTPHLDQLAEEGVTFTHAFNTASTCRPSLMSLLTGLYPGQWNQRVSQLRAEGRSFAPFREIQGFQTLPDLLRERGYVSFQGGKYWEGTYEQGGFTHGMKKQVPGRSGPKFRSKNAGGSSLVLGRSTMQPLWDFLDEFGGREPFFVWFAPMLPHKPFDAPTSYLERYESLDLSAQSAAYYANITRFDDLVGEIVGYLERRGLRNNTLLVYVSDNGWQQDPQARYGPFGGPRGKWTMHDLGFRTPIILNWPGQLPRGVRNPVPISTVDLFPTLLDFAGLPAPPDRKGKRLQPFFGGRQPEQREPVIMVAGGFRKSNRIVSSPAFALRNDSWHFIRQGRDEKLFAIDRDPDEQHDVASAHPELTRRFTLEIYRWKRDMGYDLSEQDLFDLDMAEIESGHPVNLLGIGGIFSEVRLLEREDATGLALTKIREGGTAWSAGFRKGDILLSVDGRPVSGLERGSRLLSNADGSKPIVIEVKRGSAVLALEIGSNDE